MVKLGRKRKEKKRKEKVFGFVAECVMFACDVSLSFLCVSETYKDSGLSVRIYFSFFYSFFPFFLVMCPTFHHEEIFCIVFYLSHQFFLNTKYILFILLKFLKN